MKFSRLFSQIFKFEVKNLFKKITSESKRPVREVLLPEILEKKIFSKI